MEEKKTRVTTSIKIEPNLWKEVKKHCIDLDKDISTYIDELLRRDLKKK